MSKAFSLIGAAALLAGCTALHRVELQGAPSPDLNTFWADQGFVSESSCPWQLKAFQTLSGCWRKSYGGPLGNSGYISATAVIEQGVEVVYVQSNRREAEAQEVVSTFAKFVSATYPTVRAVATESSSWDLR